MDISTENIHKRIKKLKGLIDQVDRTLSMLQQQLSQLQGQINQQMQHKVSLTGGIIELNQLLPEEERYTDFISIQQEPEPHETPRPRD